MDDCSAWGKMNWDDSGGIRIPWRGALHFDHVISNAVGEVGGKFNVLGRMI